MMPPRLLLVTSLALLIGGALGYTCPKVNNTAADLSKSASLPPEIAKYAKMVPGGAKVENADGASQSKKAIWLVKLFRAGKGKEYYEGVLAAVRIQYCEQFASSDRFVADTDPDVYKENGGCVAASDDTAPSGYCERKGNCYWEDPVAGEARKRKYTTAQADEAKTLVTQYVTTLGYVLAPGVVLAVLNLLVFFFVAICRCCCKKCGGRPKAVGYTAYQRYTPVLFYVLFAIGVLVCAAVAFVGSNDITIGIVQTFEVARYGILRFQMFLSRLRGPLLSISGVTSKAVDETVSTLSNTDWLGPGLYGVVDRVRAFRTLYGSQPSLSFVVSSLNSTLASITSQVDPIVTNAQDSIDALQGQLVPVKDTIVGVVGQAVAALSGVNETVKALGNEQLDAFATMHADIQVFQLAGVMVLFAFSIVLIVVASIGIGAGLTPCKWDDCLMCLMHISWTCGTLLVTLAFLVSALALFLGVFWYDSCNFLSVVTSDFGTYLPDPTMANALSACWSGTSLLTALNLSQSLAFADTLSGSFGQMAGFNVSSAFDSVGAPLRDVEYSLLHFDGTVGIRPVNNFTNYHFYNPTSPCLYDDAYQWAHVETPWVGTSSKTVTLWNGGISYTRQAGETPREYIRRIYADTSNCGTTLNNALYTTWETAFNTSVAFRSMRRNLGVNSTVCSLYGGCPTSDFAYDTSINAELLIYQANITKVNGKLLNLTNSFVGELVGNVDKFKCAVECSFVRDTYQDLTGVMCTQLLGGFLQIALSLFMLAVFMLILNILTLIIKTRLSGGGRRVFSELAEDGQGDEQQVEMAEAQTVPQEDERRNSKVGLSASSSRAEAV